MIQIFLLSKNTFSNQIYYMYGTGIRKFIFFTLFAGIFLDIRATTSCKVESIAFFYPPSHFFSFEAIASRKLYI